MPDPVDPIAAARQALAWRVAHPQATLAEIEAQVDAALVAFRSQTVAELAGTTPDVGPPRCPACDRPMQRHGVRTRHLVTRDEGQLNLPLPRYRCSVCGTERSPPR